MVWYGMVWYMHLATAASSTRPLGLANRTHTTLSTVTMAMPRGPEDEVPVIATNKTKTSHIIVSIVVMKVRGLNVLRVGCPQQFAYLGSNVVHD